MEGDEFVRIEAVVFVKRKPEETQIQVEERFMEALQEDMYCTKLNSSLWVEE